MKLQNGVEIISLEKRHGRIQMQSRFNSAAISHDPRLPERVKERLKLVSQWSERHKGENFNYARVDDVLPRDEDAISVTFRALSKRIVEGHWLDFTTDGVLEEAVEMLRGQTVYPNHQFWDINLALGSVSEAVWDAKGENSGGTPGINAVYSIDALMNPRIARGLLWKPFPYIHSTSLTVLFEFDYSHPRLIEEGKFWVNLGEEIDGETVRLIVTKIREIWEASLVFQGADRLAKQPVPAVEVADVENLSRARHFPAPEDSDSNNLNEGHTMHLTKEQKAELGIEFEGTEVPAAQLFKAAQALAAKNKQYAGIDLAGLQQKAAQSATLLAAKRTEVTRLARIAECGAEEAALDEIIALAIAEADAEKLVRLEAYYGRKAASRFPAGGRSSLENSAQIEIIGGTEKTGTTTVSVGGLV